MGSAPSKPAAAPASPTRPSRVADKQEKKPSESLLFDDAEEKTMEGMEVISRSQVNESLGGPMPMMGGASEELTQMFREMQRRVAALVGRIDELVDARDRLERQVAAQTEELRVQRAAIARTQRAVRNLSTREEAGDDEPTEPALRDPN
jgi:septal ring factor EnvC (AmiA/AmiB activator)